MTTVMSLTDNLQARLSELEVIFIEVGHAGAKKECLVTVAMRYFLAGWRLLFVVDNEAAQDYLDQLLWTLPPELMLPHVVSQKGSTERIVITCRTDANLNQAELLFNLRTEPLVPQGSCRRLLELWDTSNPSRQGLAEHRYQLYQQQGYQVQRCSLSQTINSAVR